MHTLLQRTPEEQLSDGYFHTLREILQQPSTWLATCAQMLRASRDVQAILDQAQTLILTGSGSSEYAGDCVRLTLQNELGITAQVIGGGTLLTQGSRALPPLRPAVIVSIARSGRSEEHTSELQSH